MDIDTENVGDELTILPEHSRINRGMRVTPAESDQPRDGFPERASSSFLYPPSSPQALGSLAPSSASSFSLRPGDTSPALFGYTDLDFLVARIESPAADDLPGSTYDDLVTLSSLIGPAADPSSGNDNTRALEELPVAFVEVERRRVLTDGRVKLKLSLMGVAVDRCGVCLSQFKKREQGVLLPCRHA